MRLARRLAAIALFVTTSGLALAASQAPAVAPDRPVLTPEQMDTFLRTAKIVSSRPVGSGVTKTRRVTLSDGTVTHDAQVQAIDEDKAVMRVQGYTEFNFRDCFCFNIAAYRLAALLGIDNVPMSVERTVDGQRTAMTWWIDDVAMTEEGRRKTNATDPNPGRFDHYRYRQRIFDELIQNRDRNLGNLVYTTDWTMWMIDHTRAFRLHKELGKPAELIRIERPLYDNLKKLTVESVAAAVGNSLRKAEVEAVLARRDAIIKVLDERIKKLSEAAVFYTPPVNQ
jgi:hypothetical protein